MTSTHSFHRRTRHQGLELLSNTVLSDSATGFSTPYVVVEPRCCFTSTANCRLIRPGRERPRTATSTFTPAQDGHLDFHTGPGRPPRLSHRPRTATSTFTPAQDGHLDFHTGPGRPPRLSHRPRTATSTFTPAAQLLSSVPQL